MSTPPAATDTPNLLTLTEAAHRLPTRPNVSTVWRWCRKGVLSRAGGRVRLEHVRLGGRVLVPADALMRFGRELAEADAEHFDTPDSISSTPTSATRSTSRTRSIERAEAELDRAGI